jgi:hypothetical protein
MSKCKICGRELDNPDDPTTKDCGGDCLKCMAEIGKDPDCIAAMKSGGEILMKQTPCQTPGAIFHTRIKDDSVAVKVCLPGKLELSEAEAAELEEKAHDAMELVLAQYWKKIKPPSERQER